MATLVVSDSAASLASGISTGTHKRLQMFLDALGEHDQLEFLFYITAEDERLGTLKEKIQRLLSQRYGYSVRVQLCQRRNRTRATRSWVDEIEGSWNFLDLLDYHAVSGPEQIRAFEQCLTRQPERLFIHRLSAMCPVLLSKSELPPIYFDLDDIEHVAYFRSLSQPPHWRSKWLRYCSLPALIWGERKAIAKARATFVCSETDRAYLARRLALNGVHVVPNTVAIPSCAPPAREPTVLFMGNYAYPPNAVAAEFLTERIWPKINAALPDAQLMIAGPAAEMIRTYSQKIPGVKYLGFVNDLDELYAKARIVVAPILSGAGTRLKIVEAAAYGRAIVSTRLGAEGLQFRDGRDIMLRDGEDVFADACVGLLRDYASCESIGKRAREFAASEYDLRRTVSKIQRLIFSGGTEGAHNTRRVAI